MVTAKDIFKDVKLNGRPLKILDQDEITKIHAQQEEQLTQNRNYEYQNNSSQNFKSNSYEGSSHLQGNRVYPNFNRNAPDYWGSEKYLGPNRRSQQPVNQPTMENDQCNDWRANSMRNTSMTCYSGSNSSQGRQDLLPSTSRNRKSDDANAIHNLMNNPNDIFGNLMNPYDVPVSRSSPDVRGRFPNRSTQEYREYNNFQDPYANERRSNNSQHSTRFNSEDDRPSRRSMNGEYDYTGAFSSQSDPRFDTQRSRFDTRNSSPYRDHPYRKHSDRESHTPGQKFANSSSGGNHQSRNPHSGERDRKYREQNRHRSRKH